MNLNSYFRSLIEDVWAQGILERSVAAVEQRLNADTSDDLPAPDQTGRECPRSPTTGTRLLSVRLLRKR